MSQSVQLGQRYLQLQSVLVVFWCQLQQILTYTQPDTQTLSLPVSLSVCLSLCLSLLLYFFLLQSPDNDDAVTTGVDAWVDRGTLPPTFCSGGDALCFVPPHLWG